MDDSTNRNLQVLRIMIIDDHPVYREALADKLRGDVPAEDPARLAPTMDAVNTGTSGCALVKRSMPV